MARLRQNTQIYNSNVYDDSTTVPSSGAAANYELAISSSNAQLDLNNIRTLISHIVSGSNGNFGTQPWYEGLSGRGVNTIDTELADLEGRPVACNATVLTDITVPSGQNWKILSVAGTVPPSEAPSLVGSLNDSTEGVVVAQSADSGLAFDAFELTERANSNDGGAIAPLNLVAVIDSSTGQPIQSGGRDVQALIQVESTFVNGSAFNNTSAGNRVKLSFVRVNSTGDDLEAVPVADIENQSINYNYIFNKFLENLDLQCFVGSRGFVDQAAAVDVTLTNAYANQSGNAPLTQSIVSEVDAVNRSWSVQDSSANNIASFGLGAAATDVEIGLGVPTTSGVDATTTVEGLDLDINVDNAMTVENGATFEGGTANLSVNTAGGGTISSDASMFLTANTNLTATATTGDVNVQSTAGALTMVASTGASLTADGNISIDGQEAGNVAVTTQQDPAGVSGDITLTTGDGNIGATQSSGDITLTTGDTGSGDIGSIILTGGTSTSATTALTGGIFLKSGDNLSSNLLTVPRTTIRSSDASNVTDGQSVPVLTLENQATGTGGGRDADLFVGNIAPTHGAQGGSLFQFSSAGSPGALYLNTSTGIGSTWEQVLTASSSALTLQAAYEGGDPVNPAGNTITTTGGSNVIINGTEDFVIGGAVDVNFDTTGAISLDADVASNFTVDGGSLTLSTVNSGDIAVQAAAATAANTAGGVTSVLAGAGNGTGVGGDLNLSSGAGGTTGSGGGVDINAGAGGATSGDGGDVTVDGGSAVDGAGGDVTLRGGDVTTSGAGGSLILQPGTGGSTGGGLGLNRFLSAGGSTLGQEQLIVQYENASSGTGGGETFARYGGTSAPAFSAETGSLFHLDDGTSGALYINDSAGGTGSSWSQLLTSSTISLTLQGAYEGGNTITTSAAEGDVIISGTEAITMSSTGDNVSLSSDLYATLASSGDTSGGGAAVVTEGVSEVFTGIGFNGLATDTDSLPIRVQTGETSGTGNSGDVFLLSGETVDGQSGDVTLSSGPGTGGTLSNTGAVTVSTGAHAATLGGQSGNLTFATGNSTNANSGDVLIDSGNASNGLSGDVQVSTGAGDTTTGSIVLSTGTPSNGSSGAINIQTANATTGAGGIQLNVGDSNATGELLNVGRITLTAGDNAGEDRAGDIVLDAGENTNVATASDGGNINLLGGDGAVGNGGDITFTPGSGGANNGVTEVTTTFAVTDPVFRYTNGTAGIQRFVSNATPEGVITGNPGDICHVETGAGSGEVYLKETGTGNTGWVQLATGGSTLTRTYWDGTMNTDVVAGVDITSANTDDVVGTFPTNLGASAAEFNTTVKVFVNGQKLQNSTQAIYVSASSFDLNFDVFDGDTISIEILA